jgi:hypothetical protein
VRREKAKTHGILSRVEIPLQFPTQSLGVDSACTIDMGRLFSINETRTKEKSKEKREKSRRRAESWTYEGYKSIEISLGSL